VTELLAPLLVGFAFGALLQRAGLSRYDRIANVYRFRDLAVVEFLLTAVAVGALGLRALTALGLAGSVPVPSTFLAGNFTGGVVFGVGMALSGFCPGTIAAGIGEGRLDYLVPGVLGLVTGGLVVGAVYTWVLPIVGRGAVAGATLPALLGADPWLVVVLLVEVSALVVYCVKRASWHDPEPESEASGEERR
jgi:uncharacterized protein